MKFCEKYLDTIRLLEESKLIDTKKIQRKLILVFTRVLYKYKLEYMNFFFW